MQEAKEPESGLYQYMHRGGWCAVCGRTPSLVFHVRELLMLCMPRISQEASTSRGCLLVLPEVLSYIAWQTTSSCRLWTRPLHPGQFGLSAAQVSMLAESVADGDADLPSDHPLSMATMRELVHMMVSVLDDVGRHLPDRNKGKGKGKAPVPEVDSSDSDDGPRMPPPPGDRGRSGGIYIGRREW